MEVQGSLGRQIQGISQQPPAVRLDGQCAEMVNMIPDVVDGTKSRMGTTHIARLTDYGEDTMATHHYRRGDGDEEYFFLMKKGQLPEVFDKKGRKCTVTTEGNPLGYLAEVTNPREDVQFMTIADVTFMLNRKKVVKTRAARSPKVGNTAIVFSAFGQYGTTYRIKINNVTAAEFRTENGENASDISTIRTERIARELYEKLLQWDGASAYDFKRDENVIFISTKDGSTDFTVSTNDGAKGQDLVAIKYKVTSTDLLPSRAPVGYKVQVWPTGSKPESRYWLQAEKKEGSLVTWKETIAADALLGFDKATMPYIIERTGIQDGIAQFVIKQGYWEDRKVGDDLTNPMPSFIDDEVPQTLGGMFMVQNRLCVTAGEAVISTRTSRFFDFFRYTVISSLATDPFDIFSDASEVYQLKHAVTLDGATILFSDKSQFLLPGDKPLEKSNALLKPVTTFEVNNRVKPVATGESVIFATSEGAYSGVREFYTDSYSDTKKAQAITSHVNRLIEGDIELMAASTNVNRLLVVASKRRNTIYCYDWLWQGTERVQAAWHKWEWPLGTFVRGMFYSGEALYLIMERGDTGVYLEVMDMGDAITYALNDNIRMDRQAELVFKHYKEEDVWRSEPLPWKPTEPELLDCILLESWDAYRGGSFRFSYDANSNTLSTTFDMHDDNHVKIKVIVGQIYPQEFEPTQVVIRDNQDRVSYIDVPTVGLVHLNLDKYPDFKVDVKNLKSGKVRRVLASNRLGGARNNIVGYVEPREGVFRFPLRALSTDVVYRIVIESPHTFQLRDIEWTGSYNPTKRRV